jgi:hypothetical protein
MGRTNSCTRGGLKPPPRLTWLRSLPNRILGRPTPILLTPSVIVLRSRLSDGSAPERRTKGPGGLRRLSTRNMRELTESRVQAQKEHLPEVTPLPPLPLLSGPVTRLPANPRTWRNTGESNGRKAKRKRKQRKRGRGGQGAKVGPDRQQAAPVALQGRPTPAPRQQGSTWILEPDNRSNLLLPCEQRKAEVNKRLFGTGQPAKAYSLGPTFCTSPQAQPASLGQQEICSRQLWMTADANVRLSLLTADRPVTTRTFWALSLGPSSSSRNVCYGSRTGTEATVVLKQIICTLAQVEVTHVRAILHHYRVGGPNSWLINHTIPQGRPLADSVSKN